MDHIGLKYLSSGRLQSTLANPLLQCVNLCRHLLFSSSPFHATTDQVTWELGKADPAPPGGETWHDALEEEGGMPPGVLGKKRGVLVKNENLSTGVCFQVLLLHIPFIFLSSNVECLVCVVKILSLS